MPRPREANTASHDIDQVVPYHSEYSNYHDTSKSEIEKIISVRITSSVAIGRGKGKTTQITNENYDAKTEFGSQTTISTTETYIADENDQGHTPDLPPNLEGANIEFIKQLNAKKEANAHNYKQNYPLQITMHQSDNESENFANESIDDETKNDQTIEIVEDPTIVNNKPPSKQDVDFYKEINKFDSSSILDEALKYSEQSTSNATDDLLTKAESKQITEVREITPSSSNDETTLDHKEHNDTDDSIAESSIKSISEIANKPEDNYENIENVPLARSVIQSPSSKNFIQGLINKPPSERESSTRLTTVSFNVVHDAPKIPTSANDPNKLYIDQSQHFTHEQKIYEPPKIYSQPAQIYSEPAKFYSEPAKIYSEPAKIYSEPAKIYSEPAKIYSEPAKFYSEPASLHLNENAPLSYMPWQQHSQTPLNTTTFNTTPVTTVPVPESKITPAIPQEHQAEKNYEVDEKVSVLTDGRSHGVQESSTEKCKQDSCKVGYVVKGRQYNKYRVEERTSDGFIVGEYGVVRNEDGALRGVRYTADSDASPRLIYDALMKFLQLK